MGTYSDYGLNRMLCSEEYFNFTGTSNETKTVNMYLLTDEELAFFYNHSCEIFKSQWMRQNAIAKLLPDPFHSLLIKMSNENYEFVGTLNYLADSVPMIRGGCLKFINKDIELHDKDLISLYNKLMKIAKEKTEEYHKYIMETEFEGV